MKNCLICGNSFESRTCGKYCSDDCRVASKKAYMVIFNRENKEDIVEYRKVRYQNNKEEILIEVKKYQQENKEEILKHKKVYYQENKEHILIERKIYRNENKEKFTSKDKLYYQRNRDEILVKIKVYQNKNRGLYNALGAKRRAAKLNATPKWLTFEHCEQIEFFFIEAKRLERLDGIKRHVDHIVPLQGKTVCGLHVPWNLQILTEFENISKSNRLVIDKY